MAKINKVINVKVEGVGKIKQLEESLKKLRKQQRDIKKDMKDGANATKEQTKQYKDSENAIKGQSKALRETKKAMLDANNTTKKSNSLQKSMTMGVIQGAAAFSILVTAFRRVSQALVSLIGTFTEFEFVMAKVKAVSGANIEEFEMLNTSAKELGRTTFFTASEVANLQLNLSKLGFTTSEILATTKATINLSIATGSDLARAATVAGNAIRGFQLDAEESTRVIDVMAVAFTSSALDIEKWQTSMTKVAPIAAMAGFSIEETTAIMAKLSDTGIEASIAGTSLRNIFLKMQDPTSELSRRVGHTVGSLDSMLEVFKNMQDEGTDLADVLKFMDVRQVAAFGTMLRGADDIKALRDELMNAEGAGQEMADTIGNTLQGSIFKVKSALEGVSLAIVEKFGGGLSDMLDGMTKWLNKLAASKTALVKLWTSIKLAVKFILSYVVGAKIATLWNGFMATSFVAAGTGATGASIAIAAVTTALNFLRIAIISTGIGFFVIALGEWAASAFFAADATDALYNAKVKIDDGMKESNKNQALANQRLKDLINTRKALNKLTNEEGELLDANKEKTHRYNILKKKEERQIKSLNKFNKAYNIEQNKINDSNEDIIDSTNRLIKAMKNQALIGVYENIEGNLLGVNAAANLVFAEFSRVQTEIPGRENYTTSTAIDDFDTFVNKHVEDYANLRMKNAAKLKALLKTYDISIAEFEQALALQYGWGEDRGGTGESMGESGYYDFNIKRVQDEMAARAGMPFDELMATLDTEEDGEPKTSREQEAIYDMQTKINEAKTKFAAKMITNEEDQQLGVLQAQRDGIAAYQAQFGKKDVEYKLAAAKLIDFDKKIADVNFSQAATAIERERTAAKIQAENNVLDKEKTIQLIDGEYKLKVAKAEDLFSVLNGIDNDKNKALLDNAKLYGKEEKDIQNQIDEQKIQSKKDNFKNAERVATQAHEKAKLDLRLELANEEISQMEHDARMLALEAEFLANMADLYAQYGQAHVDIDNQITENTIATKEQQKAALREYISALGELGGFMQDVAGEEDKMNAVRKAGIIITEGAAAAEKIMALMTTLSTLATKADIALAPAKVGADAAKTGSTLALTGAKFLESIADGIKNLPWWAQIIGLIAIVAMIKKVKNNISAAFKTPDAGGGGDISSDSGGGSSGGGGMMSLMTFGGRHQTVGEVDSYADGGMVHGKSHAQGGEKFAVGGRVVELEGGEAVINKRSTSMFRSQLSAMNTAGGGARFADGGIANVPSFSQTQFQVDGQRGLQGAIGQKSKVVVVESDITKSQNTVTTIQSEASF